MSDLVPYQSAQDVDSWVDVMAPIAKLADYIARTAFVPKALQGNAPAVAATILTGRELGMGPLTALRSLDVIEGSVQMKTKAILARIYAAGHRVEWLAVTDQAAEVRIERGDGLGTAQIRWTMADATRAGLADKPTWRKYPRAMLRARALAEAAELACPDVILGMEAGDAHPTEPAPATRTTIESPVLTVRPVEPLSTYTEDDTIQVVEVVVDEATGRQEAPILPAGDPLPAPRAEPAADPITPAQMRAIGALIGKHTTKSGIDLDRVARRQLIARMADLDPDALTSAKNLTRAEASRAIENLQASLDAGTTEPA